MNNLLASLQTPEYFIPILIFIGIIFLLLLRKKPQNSTENITEKYAELKSQILTNTQKIQNISQELEEEKNQKNQLLGQNKSLEKSHQELQYYTQNLEKNYQEILKKSTKLENQKEILEQSTQEKITQLSHAQQELEQERKRLQAEEKAAQEEKLQQITKAWNTHEQNVNFQLEEACQNSLTRFRYFTNQNIPPNFSGKIKPDFCIEFLGQYCIFDAKKSKNITPYLRDQSQKTAEKYKNFPEIYPTIFFIVPEDSMNFSETAMTSSRLQTSATTVHRPPLQTKKIPQIFSHHHLSFIPITPSQIFPTLFLLKKISHYQSLTEFDPQDREALVRLISHYQRHIDFQNATNILLAQKSQNFSDEKTKLPKNFQQDLENYQTHMPHLKLKESEVKELIQKKP